MSLHPNDCGDSNPYSLMWAVLDWFECPIEQLMWDVADLDYTRIDQGIPSAFE